MEWISTGFMPSLHRNFMITRCSSFAFMKRLTFVNVQFRSIEVCERSVQDSRNLETVYNFKGLENIPATAARRAYKGKEPNMETARTPYMIFDPEYLLIIQTMTVSMTVCGRCHAYVPSDCMSLFSYHMSKSCTRHLESWNCHRLLICTSVTSICISK
jgi:hypothetical protein